MFLRRRTRAACDEFRLEPRASRCFAAATYEAARLVLADTGSADVSLQLVDGSSLQVAIVGSATRSPGSWSQLERAVRGIETLVQGLSVEVADTGVCVSFAAPIATGSGERQGNQPAASPDGSVPGSGGEVQRGEQDEPAILAAALRELDDANASVAALGLMIVQQARELEEKELDLRARAEALIEANRAKEDFLATLSHELRTPLNAMLGWTRLLRMGKLNPLARARALETIERNARVQETLIADILDMSRIVTGKMRLELKPVSLTPVVDAALDTVRPAAEAKGVVVSCHVPFTGTVLGDPERLQQVVWNLLANAIKFTPNGGRVSIEVAAAASNVEVTVSDTGQGMSPDLVPTVFDRFTQGDSSVARPHGGLGLGLSIVRHIVELHGGQVEAFSDGPGRGSRFVVRLPVRTLRPDRKVSP